MRRMAVPGCTLLVVAGCGGGRSSSVEEMTQTGSQETKMRPAEPAVTPTLSTMGAYETAPVDDVGNDVTAVFHR